MRRGHRHQRRTRRWRVLVLGATALAVPIGQPAVAQVSAHGNARDNAALIPVETTPPDTTPPDTTPSGNGTPRLQVTVEAGPRALSDPGETIVVSVTVTSRDLFDGRVEIESSFGAALSSKALQVPGGTTKTVYVLTPTANDGNGLRVVLVDDSGVVSTRQASRANASDVEVVGLLPQLLARTGEVADSVNLDDDTGRAALVPLALEILDLGPLALDAYDTVVATGADLSALDDDERGALLTWVGEGGRLLLDDGSAVGLLPTAWQPGPDGYSLAGAGEIRLVDGAASRGEFATIIESSPDVPSETVNSGRDLVVSGQPELATRAGVRLPALGSLLIGIVIYALVVGPIAYLVLRRLRRLTAAWVVLPGLALLTTAGITLSGDRFRSTGSPATSTFVETSAGGATALSTVLTFSRGGGERSIDAPADWTTDVASINWFGFDQSSSVQGRLVQSSDGSRVTLDLDPGQVTTVTMVGPTTHDGLTTTAQLVDDTVVGTVTNDTPYTLHDVAVFTTSDAESLTDLAPGATATWEIEAPERNDPFTSLSTTVWGDPNQGIGFLDSEYAELGNWGVGDIRYGLYLSGMVRVAGWTDERPSDASPGNSSSDRSVITTRQPIAPEAGSVHPGTVRAQVVQSPFGMFGDGFGPTIIRYLLPPGSPETGFTFDSIGDPGKVEAWTGTTWVELDVVAGAAEIPDAAVRDGVVLLRFAPDLNGAFDPSQVPTVATEDQR